MLPVYRPRGSASSDSIICMLIRLGAPVMLPQGKAARRMSAAVMCGRAWAWMVLVICQTLPKRDTLNGSGTLTLPVWAILPRSLRSKSTIITFSARFFGSACNSAARRSSCPSPKIGAVPFIGSVLMVPSAPILRKSSGEKHSVHADFPAASGRWDKTA